MKKAAKWVGLVAASAVCLTSVAALAACNDEPEIVEYTVTFYDGSSVLDTQKVKEGEKAERWTPTKDDYTFVDWYATPNSTAFLFDFDAPVTENKSAFAQWASAVQSNDTREYFIAGSGTSPVLRANSWGKGDNAFTAATKMSKASDKNEYTYTLDLYEGDEFQFAINADWHNQRGYGYLKELKLADGTAAFSGAGTIGDNSSYRMNIKCEYSGNYTFTLATHPDDDVYETTHPEYTEAKKESFNINPLDSLLWKRNGDVSEEVEVVTDFYIKGSGITGWSDVYSPATKMSNNDGVHTLEVYLKADEEFLFTSQNTIGDEVSVGTEYLRASNLDEASKAFLDQKPSYNMVAKASGTYTFTYTEATKVLTVAFDADKALAAYDYYLDGAYGGGDWGDFMTDKSGHKLAETPANSGVYKITGVELAANEELVICAYAAGEETLTWGNMANKYNAQFLVDASGNVARASETNVNIKVLKAGTYDVTINSYTKIVSFEKTDVTDWAYIVSSASGEGGWKVSEDYKMTYSETDESYSVTLNLAEGEEFGIRIMQGETTTQRYWFASGQVDGTAPEGLLVSGSSNIKCTAAGRYVITCKVVGGNATVTLATAE